MTTLAVSLFDCAFDSADGFAFGQDVADGEETGLHNRVDALGHAHLASDTVGVNDKEAQVLFDDLLLHFAWEMVPDFIWPEGRVQEKSRTGFGPGKDI